MLSQKGNRIHLNKASLTPAEWAILTCYCRSFNGLYVGGGDRHYAFLTADRAIEAMNKLRNDPQVRKHITNPPEPPEIGPELRKLIAQNQVSATNGNNIRIVGDNLKFDKNKNLERILIYFNRDHKPVYTTGTQGHRIYVLHKIDAEERQVVVNYLLQLEPVFITSKETPNPLGEPPMSTAQDRALSPQPLDITIDEVTLVNGARADSLSNTAFLKLIQEQKDAIETLKTLSKGNQTKISLTAKHRENIKLLEKLLDKNNKQ